MRLFDILFSKIKEIILSNKASLLITFAYSLMPLLIAVFCVINLIDLNHKKISMDSVNNAVILSATSKMASNFNYFGNNITSYSEKVIIDNTKKNIRHNIKESLSIDTFDRKDINYIADNVKIYIAPHNKVNDYKDRHVYNINSTIFYDYHFKFLGKLLSDNIYYKIVSFVSSILTINNSDDSVSFVEFVIDLSGSMTCPMDANPEDQTLFGLCGKDKKHSKIQALKNAMMLLLDTIGRLPNVTQRFYMGLIGYTENITKQITPSWGVKNISRYILQDMDAIALGGTNSSPAMKKAYKELTADEKSNFLMKIFHKKSKVPSLPFRKYIIFLTDGANNYPASDKKTLKICEKAKKHSIKIFTISINAPAVGRNLLKKCAHSIEEYYNVADINSLLKVFKNISTAISKNKYNIVLNA